MGMSWFGPVSQDRQGAASTLAGTVGTGQHRCACHRAPQGPVWACQHHVPPSVDAERQHRAEWHQCRASERVSQVGAVSMPNCSEWTRSPSVATHAVPPPLLDLRTAPVMSHDTERVVPAWRVQRRQAQHGAERCHSVTCMRLHRCHNVAGHVT